MECGLPPPFDADGVYRVSNAEFQISERPWMWAASNQAAIEAHWLAACRERSHYFNGTVHLATGGELRDEVFSVQLLKSDFKSYLYWRAQGYPGAGVIDAFGSGLLRSADGCFLLVRQRPGNINSGLAYLPGGFIDDKDVSPASDGSKTIAIAHSIAREVQEETGLVSGSDYSARPGYLVTRAGPHLSFAQMLQSGLPGEALLDRVGKTIAGDPNGELEAAILVKSPDDLTDLAMPAYARLLMGHVFARA
jgi:8-oxo-dGTP pyrophosphatase MutT (NUDIX family)